jgi:hypothetical protein
MRVRTKFLTLHELPSSGDVAQPRCMQVELQPKESATVTLIASHEQLSTAFADGTRSIVPGKRTVWTQKPPTNWLSVRLPSQLQQPAEMLGACERAQLQARVW